MTTLSDTAVIVRLSLTMWDGLIREPANIAEAAYGVKKGTIKTVVSDLLPNGCGVERDMLRTVLGEARTYHYAHTLRWMNKGEHLCTTEHFIKEYMPRMNQMKDKAEKLYGIFVQAFPQRMIDAAQMRGPRYDAKHYPSTRDLNRRFAFDVAAYPVPSHNALANLLGGEVAANMEREIEAAMNAAMTDAYQRLHEAVAHMAEKLGDEKAIFRDTLISNVEELCSILPGLNVSGDRRLDEFVKEVKSSLLAHKPDTLRDGGCARAETASRALAISNKLKAFALTDDEDDTQLELAA